MHWPKWLPRNIGQKPWHSCASSFECKIAWLHVRQESKERSSPNVETYQLVQYVGGHEKTHMKSTSFQVGIVMLILPFGYLHLAQALWQNIAAAAAWGFALNPLIRLC